MKRILFAIAVLVASLSAYAQAPINIDIYEYGTQNRCQGLHIYSFITRDEANAAYERTCMKNAGKKGWVGYFQKSDKYIADKTYNGNQTQIRAYDKGYLIIDDEVGTVTPPIHIPDYMVEENGEKVFKYYFKPETSKNVIGKRTVDKGHATNYDTEIFRINKVDIKVGKRLGAEDKMTADQCGHTITYTGEVNLKKNFTGTNSRFVVAPYLLNGKGDTLYNVEPVVVDGLNYHKSMHRYMGFKRIPGETHDRDQELHDKLGRWVRQDIFMQDHMDTLLTFSGTITNDSIREDTKYRIVGHMWYEDYNHVYQMENKQLWDGNAKGPKRYLDWKDALSDVGFDPDRYNKERISLVSEGTARITLNFVVGKEYLTNDSITRTNLNNVIEQFNGYKGGDDGYLLDVTVRSMSSPEGGEDFNRKLSRKRNEYIKQLIRSRVKVHYNGLYTKLDAFDNVVQWDSVATFLDGKDDARCSQIAEDIRTVTAKTRRMAEQNAIFARRSWWKFMNDSIFPQLRMVEIKWTSKEEKIMPCEDTYKRFNEKWNGYYDCTK